MTEENGNALSVTSITDSEQTLTGLSGAVYDYSQIIVILGLTTNPFLQRFSSDTHALLDSYRLIDLLQAGDDGISIPLESVAQDFAQCVVNPDYAPVDYFTTSSRAIYLLWDGVPVVRAEVKSAPATIELKAVDLRGDLPVSDMPTITSKALLPPSNGNAPWLVMECYDAKEAPASEKTVEVSSDFRQDVRLLYTALRGLLGFVEAVAPASEHEATSVTEYVAASRIVEKMKVKYGL